MAVVKVAVDNYCQWCNRDAGTRHRSAKATSQARHLDGSALVTAAVDTRSLIPSGTDIEEVLFVAGAGVMRESREDP